MDSAKPAKELESCFLKFFQIRNTPGEKNIICSSSRITHLLKLLHRLVSRGTAAALEPKKVIALKVKVQKEIKYIRLLELELGWFWFMSGKPPWEGAMPSKPSGWSKKTSFFYKEFNGFKFFPMQAVDQSLCALPHNTVTRLMREAK